jgi:hypothetical protein
VGILAVARKTNKEAKAALLTPGILISRAIKKEEWDTRLSIALPVKDQVDVECGHANCAAVAEELG